MSLNPQANSISVPRHTKIRFGLRTLLGAIFVCAVFAAVLAPLFRTPAKFSFSSGALSAHQNAEIVGPRVFGASGQPTIAFGIIRSTNPPQLASRQMAYVIVLDHPSDTEIASTFRPTTLAQIQTISGSFVVGKCTIALDHSIDHVVGEEQLHVNGQSLDITRGRLLIFRFNDDCTSFVMTQRKLPACDLREFNGLVPDVYRRLNARFAGR